MNSRLPILLLALLASAPLSFGDLITGRVVDSNGVGVAGININAFRTSNGNEEGLANDGTDANGNFSTTIPGNVYDLHFIPPQPPATTHVPLVLRSVVVAGTKDLGTLTLQAGVSISGHLQTQAAVPVSQVTVIVIDKLTGFEVPQAQRKSNAFGNFSVAAPKNALELQLDATGLAGPVLASMALSLAPTTDTNLGNITLLPGMTVTGHVQRAVGGTAVPTVDLDFTAVPTGQRLFTPNDNSNSLGNFSVVVPAGTYDIDFCAPFASHLVGLGSRRTVTSNLDLGTIALDPGFVMSGTIRSSAGVPQVGADVDVRIQGVGSVVTCSDNSNASGVYAIIVPAGTLKVTFDPANYNLGLGSGVVKNLVVSGDLTLDGTLPACAPATNYGTGLAGTGGLVPHLTVSGGVPATGNPNFAFELQNGRGGATAFMMVGVATASIPTLGGTVLVNPSSAVRFSMLLGGTAGVAGAGSKHFPIPVLVSLVGVNLYAQFFVQDPGAPQGWAFSDACTFRVCR